MLLSLQLWLSLLISFRVCVCPDTITINGSLIISGADHRELRANIANNGWIVWRGHGGITLPGQMYKLINYPGSVLSLRGQGITLSGLGPAIEHNGALVLDKDVNDTRYAGAEISTAIEGEGTLVTYSGSLRFTSHTRFRSVTIQAGVVVMSGQNNVITEDLELNDVLKLEKGSLEVGSVQLRGALTIMDGANMEASGTVVMWSGVLTQSGTLNVGRLIWRGGKEKECCFCNFFVLPCRQHNFLLSFQ